MNCETFEEVVNDLARNRIMETEKRESGLAHARACDRCAARLSDERALTGGLGALSASLQDREALPHVEAALLNAFRERSTSQRASAAITEPSIPSIALVDDIKGRRRNWRVAAGVAAAILLAALVSVVALTPAPEREQRAVATDPPAPPQTPPRTPGREAPAHGGEQAAAPVNLERSVAQSPSRPRDGRGQSRRKPRPEAREAEEVMAAEVATEFMPIGYGYPPSQMARGHIVRVELPRSAMTSFGLPVNHERSESRVKADVLIGEDGLARAIRFVR
ncbi:MAG TPA: hypothetical protein VE262_05970 [Blastocatellia bacterium]|nr:hypothetical protein [Blastocatellia bacterium]